MKNNNKDASSQETSTQVDILITGPRIDINTINNYHGKKDNRVFETNLILRINGRECVINSFEKTGYKQIMFSVYNSALNQIKKLPKDLRSNVTVNGQSLRKAKKIVEAYRKNSLLYL